LAEDEEALRRSLVETGRRIAPEGLGRGTAGNLSVRCGSGFLITPTGMPYQSLRPGDLALVAPDGSWRGDRAPSSEWRLHRDLYARCPAAGAVVHTHSPFAVAIACLRRDIPPFHYMVARFGGDSVRCAAYATYGTQQLSDHALAALEGRCGALLANHGAVVCADRLDRAFGLAIELEELCAQFWRASQLGLPVLLSSDEMAQALERFAGYGQPG
jgi:L-fuculose-phosphate aldolase